MVNKRMEARGELVGPVRLSCPGGGEVDAFALDLSASGISFLSDRAYAAGHCFLLTLSIPGEGVEAEEEEVELVARTVRCDPTGDLIPYRLAAHFFDLEPTLQERLRRLATPHGGGVALHLAHD